VQEIIQKTNNVSNAIIEATEKSYPKVIQID
jgi:hypothetical protein